MKTVLLAAIIGASAPAMPQEKPKQLLREEIIVTAQKREQNILEVPISVAVVSGDTISKSGINNLDQLSKTVPNLSISHSSGTTYVIIRGIGSGDDFSMEQSASMFIDGVYAGRSRQYRTPLFDISRVEVLKGPQDTLFGKNTIAGAISVITAKPSDIFMASALINYEPKYRQYNTEAILSGPLTNTLSGRLAVKKLELDGRIYNSLSGDTDSSKNESLLRASLLWAPNSDLEVLSKYETSRFETGGNNIRLISSPLGAVFHPLYQSYDPDYRENPFRRSASPNEQGKTQSDNISITSNLSLGEYTISSISAYSSYDYDENQDVDFSPIPLLEREIIEDFKQLSQEVRFTSPVDDVFDYIIGLYYHTSALDNQVNTDIALGELPTLTGFPPFRRQVDYERDTNAKALFGQASWHFDARYHINLGLRYTHETVKASRQLVFNNYFSQQAINPTIPTTPTGFPAPLDNVLGVINFKFGIFEHSLNKKRSVEKLSPSLKLQMDVNDQLMLYTSAAQSFKSGGFNSAETTGNIDTYEFNDEKALSYEIGGKLSLLEAQGYVNFSFFYTQYDDLQVSSFIGESFVVGNAASAISQGIEIDSQFTLNDTLTLQLSAAYLDARYNHYENGPCTIQTLSNTPFNCHQDLSNQSLSQAPNWTANTSIEHRGSLGTGFTLSTQLDLLYSDGYHQSSDHDPNVNQSSYLRVNARLGLESHENWSLALIGKNLTNKEVAFLGSDAPLQPGIYNQFINDPRTVTLQFSMQFF